MHIVMGMSLSFHRHKDTLPSAFHLMDFNWLPLGENPEVSFRFLSKPLKRVTSKSAQIPCLPVMRSDVCFSSWYPQPILLFYILSPKWAFFHLLIMVFKNPCFKKSFNKPQTFFIVEEISSGSSFFVPKISIVQFYLSQGQHSVRNSGLW